MGNGGAAIGQLTGNGPGSGELQGISLFISTLSILFVGYYVLQLLQHYQSLSVPFASTIAKGR